MLYEGRHSADSSGCGVVAVVARLGHTEDSSLLEAMETTDWTVPGRDGGCEGAPSLESSSSGFWDERNLSISSDLFSSGTRSVTEGVTEGSGCTRDSMPKLEAISLVVFCFSLQQQQLLSEIVTRVGHWRLPMLYSLSLSLHAFFISSLI